MYQNAQSPLDYQTSRLNTTYNLLPTNWRPISFYTILMDKFADGDPSNNDYLVPHLSMIGEKTSYELAGISRAWYLNWTTSLLPSSTCVASR
jgi:hypothetical protein